MQTILPTNNQLFCQEDGTQDITTKSGIFIQAEVQEKPQTAHVINVGSGVKDIKSKDTIVYKPYATTVIKLDRKEYFLINQEDVLGVVVDVEA